MTAAQSGVAQKSLSFHEKAWHQLKHNHAAMVSLIFLLFIAVVSVASLFWMPHDPNAQNVSLSNLKPFTNGSYPLGTDGLGRDMFSRLLYGTRISLMIALFATLVDILVVFHTVSFPDGVVVVLTIFYNGSLKSLVQFQN